MKLIDLKPKQTTPDPAPEKKPEFGYITAKVPINVKIMFERIAIREDLTQAHLSGEILTEYVESYLKRYDHEGNEN